MKIEFDKALLWLLPYLYITSIFYYWGYWGAFDIDAFNYYDVSDIIKGVISPIRSVLYYTIAVVAIYQVNEIIHKPIKEIIKKLKIWQAISIITIISIVGLGIFGIAWFSLFAPFITSTPDVNNWVRFILLNNMSFVFGVLVVTKVQGESWNLKTWLLIICAALPLRAFTSGKENALLVLENKKFNYIIADSLVYPEKNIYKLLGKVGEHNILLSMDNEKQIIIPSDKIIPLIVESYSISSKASIKSFRRNVKLVYGRKR